MNGPDRVRLRSFDVVIKGGKPWGFQLSGGTDVNGPPLIISQVECGGKVEAMGSLHVGDQLLRVNDVFCSSLSMAEQLVESAFRTLTLTVWRGNVETHGGRLSAATVGLQPPETLSCSPLGLIPAGSSVGGGEAAGGAAGGRCRDHARDGTTVMMTMEESHERRASSGADIRVSRTASSCGESRMKEWRNQHQQQLKLQPPRYGNHGLHHQVADGQHQRLVHQQSSHMRSQQHQQVQRRNSLAGSDQQQRERSHSFHESPRTTTTTTTTTNQRPLPGHYGVQQQHSVAWTGTSSVNSSPTRKLGSKAPSETELTAESIYENVTSLRHPVPKQLPVMDIVGSAPPPSSSNAPTTISSATTEVAMRLRPALERERRSLRKLTKDSGYETSPYSESDYANMEWLSDQNSEHGVVSPSPTHGRQLVGAASALCAYWDTASMSDQEAGGGPYSSMQRHSGSHHHPKATTSSQYKPQKERSYPGRSAPNPISRSKSAIYEPDSYVSSSDVLRRLSQGNVWLAQQQLHHGHHQQQVLHQDPFQGRYSSTDSLCSSYSSSTTSGTGSRFNHRYQPSSAKSTPSLVHHGVTSTSFKSAGFVQDESAANASCLAASMNSSRSTPNLDKETSYAVDQLDAAELMVSRKFKKASVYEALANKSGLDFAPSIQGRNGGADGGGHHHPQPHQHMHSHANHQRSTSNSSFAAGGQQRYHYRHVSSQSTASDGTSSSGNSQSHHSRQESGQSSYSEDDSRVMSPRSEESDGGPVFSYHGSISLQAFPSERYDSEDLLDDRWASVECDSYPSGLMNSPPPPVPPVRDGSSLMYMSSSDYHDKYPSWPISASLSSDNCQLQQQQQQPVRSSSMTANDLVSEKAVAYARLRKYAQSYTHQLKTVVEKSERNPPNSDPRLITVQDRATLMHGHTAPEDRGLKQQQQRITNSGQHSSDEPLDDTPLLDRLRLESKHWSSDCGLECVKRGGGRDSITSTTSSQETLKWHGSSSDVSVNSDKHAASSRSSAVDGPGAVVHSARVKPPQRHNSESVLYYGTAEEQAMMNLDGGLCQGSISGAGGLRAVQRVKPNKRECPASSTTIRSLTASNSCCSDDQAPPLPRKIRQWSEQVQKNNYINQIQMQIRPLADNLGSGIRAGSLAREEIQPPVSPEFAKPLSVAERIQDLERQARSGVAGSRQQQAALCNGTVDADQRVQGRSPYVLVAGLMQKVPNGPLPSGSPSSSSMGSGTASTDEMRMAYLDPEKRHKVSDPELKAIQKQAVLSFFERQMGITTGQGKGSTNNGSAKAAMISRRVAQSLPRDYFHEFKRMQQDNDKRNAAASRAGSASTPRMVAAVGHEGTLDVSSSRTEKVASSPSRRHDLPSHMKRQTSTGGADCSSLSKSPSAKSLSSKDQSLGGGKRFQVDEESNDQHMKYLDSDGIVAPQKVDVTPVNGIFKASAVSIDAPVMSERNLDFGATLEQQPAIRCGSTEKALSNGFCEFTASNNAASANDEDDHDDHRSSRDDISSVLKIEEPETVQQVLQSNGSMAGSTPHTRRRLLVMMAATGSCERVNNGMLLRSRSSSSGGSSSSSPIANCSRLSQSSRCSTPDLPLPPPPPLPSATGDDASFDVNNEPLPPPPSFGEMGWDAADVQSPRSPKGSCLSSFRGEPPQSPTAVDDVDPCSNQRPTAQLLSNGNMDTTTVSPNSWEQWHNVRQSNTTLVFHSSEMLSSKPSHLKPLSRVEPTAVNGKNSCRIEESAPRTLSSSSVREVKSHSPPHEQPQEPIARQSPSRGSTESLRSSSSSTVSCSSTVQSSDALATATTMPLLGSSSQAKDRVTANNDRSINGVLIEAETQTTPSVAAGGKIGRRKRDEELECERLSLDLLNHLSGQDTALRHILVSAPNMKTMADYMEGLLDVDIDADCSNGQLDHHRPSSRFCSANSAASSSSSNDQSTRHSSDTTPLPSDSAYFTTSESKARFMTRYHSQELHRSPLEEMSSSSELTKKKEELVDSITRKLEILRTEHLAVREEICLNNDLGSAVTDRVEQLARPNEVDKFKLHVEEVEKITSLLLGLSGRLARAENALMTLPPDANSDSKRLLEAKRNKLSEQHEEAKKLKENIDRRSCQVSQFLRKYFSSEEYADYDHFVKMKVKLLMDYREIDDRIKLGEEQMTALELNLSM